MIPYIPKTDVALDSLQTFVECFESLKDEYISMAHNPPHDNEFTDPKLLTVMEMQSAVNKSILYLIETIMAPTYSRAEHH